jgi:hypothetical protein
MKQLSAFLRLALVVTLTCAPVRAQFAMAPPAFDPNVYGGYAQGYGYGYGGFNGYNGYNPNAGYNGNNGFPGYFPGNGGQWGQPQHPPAPYFPGFSRAECINFEFSGLRPSAELKLRITRTNPKDRKVLYQRALFVMKHDDDALAKATADWVRQQIEAIPQGS